MNKAGGTKYALIALTPNGCRLAKKVQAAFADHSCTIFAKKASGVACQPFTRLRDLMPELVASYDALIFFSAVGIAVRLTAPFACSKDKDPAVIAIDECGKFAVSVLSGHLGGANSLCQELAATLDAIPVITTATDANGLLAPDELARQLHLQPWPIESIKKLNGHLLEYRQLNYYIDAQLPLPLRNFYFTRLTKLHQAVQIKKRNALPPFGVFLTAQPTLLPPDCLSLIIPQLCAGIGCRRGTRTAELTAALEQACRRIDCSFFNISCLASTDFKADEPGLLQLGEQYSLPIAFYDQATLQQTIEKYELSISPFVEKTIGIGNVCEAAALSDGDGKLLLPKTKFKKVTVALKWQNSL